MGTEKFAVLPGRKHLGAARARWPFLNKKVPGRAGAYKINAQGTTLRDGTIALSVLLSVKTYDLRTDREMLCLASYERMALSWQTGVLNMTSHEM
ncbi:hypothetical protein EVAR_14907_1 [Eumeta japonica]|uniref:Uncharacterized protein n=1 Tax=Eumeta variegata TaxID=151549 RepID=A0A4C1XQ79_EUMVA|nr:hypothetical protein EVAR_14907_1 [Eumeta japonica]